MGARLTIFSWAALESVDKTTFNMTKAEQVLPGSDLQFARFPPDRTLKTIWDRYL